MHLIKDINYSEFLEIYINDPQNVIFFTGAGLSYPLFPSWSELLASLIEECHQKSLLKYPRNELIVKLNSHTDYLDIAEELVSSLGESDYREFLDKNLNKQFNYEDIPQAYKLLLKMKPQIILTMNYDKIPEIGGNNFYDVFTHEQCVEALNAINNKRNIVLKVNGDISNKSSIILTRFEFNNIIYKNIALKTLLSSLLNFKTVLFIGTSLSDPHIGLILEYLNVTFSGRNIKPYMLSEDIGQLDKSIIEKKYGIKSILFNNEDNTYNGVLEFFISINNKGDNNDYDKDLNNYCLTIASELNKKLNYESIFVNLSPDNQILNLHIDSKAQTEYERQKELLKIFKNFTYHSQIIKKIKIGLHLKVTGFVNNFNEYHIFMNTEADLKNVILYNSNKLNELDFWNTLKFSMPTDIDSIQYKDHVITINYINF